MKNNDSKAQQNNNASKNAAAGKRLQASNSTGKWITEKCGTNTPPANPPKNPSTNKSKK